MIGKIIKGKSFKGCVSYVLDKAYSTLLDSEGVLLGDTASIINSFYMQSLMNPKLAKSVGHIPLSYSIEDAPKMTDELMVQLAKEYMKAMKIANTQYIIVRHSDKLHPHCHIIFNRVDNDGKTISDKNDRYHNTKVCKMLKEQYGLHFGEGKEKVNLDSLKDPDKTKYEIYHAIKDALKQAKDWNWFEQVLSRNGVTIAYKYKGKTGEVQGVSFKEGEYSFKGSDIDRGFSYSKLDGILYNNSRHQEQQQIAIPKEIKTTPENILSGAMEIVSALGGLLAVQPSDYDSTEAEYLRQQALKRKNKKKRRGGFGL